MKYFENHFEPNNRNRKMLYGENVEKGAFFYGRLVKKTLFIRKELAIIQYGVNYSFSEKEKTNNKRG